MAMVAKIPTKLTPKENYLRLLHGEIPEWIPSYSYYGPFAGVPEMPPNAGFMGPSFMNGDRGMGGGKDVFGVEWVPTKETGGMALPKPGAYILDDIRKWRDIIKVPSLSGINWEEVIKKDLEAMPVNRQESTRNMMTHLGFFQTLCSFMGFNEGMMAMYEEPEEVKALFEYLSDFYLKLEENMIDILKPDVLQLADDTAAEKFPFISREMYHDFLIPLYDKAARFGRERNIPVGMHNCGHAEVYFDDLVKIGIVAWDPVQLSNDIKNVQAKFGRHLVILGGWEGRGRLLDPDVTDEEIRQSVRTALDSYGQNGGFIFAGSFMGPAGDPVTDHKNEVIQTEAYIYGHTFYK
jgi:hypothetical protein